MAEVRTKPGEYRAIVYRTGADAGYQMAEYAIVSANMQKEADRLRPGSNPCCK